MPLNLMYCGCCGNDSYYPWCNDCTHHVLPEQDGFPEERTYFAQHGEPCPYQEQNPYRTEIRTLEEENHG